MSNKTESILKRLRDLGDSDVAAGSQRFFKTGKGEYGEGDCFLGIRVPTLRKCVKDFAPLSMDEIATLVASPYHEVRMFALLMLVKKYGATTENAEKEAVYHFYLDHTRFINNWDLVDCSAPHIVGAHLYPRDRQPIYRLIGSSSLWERRIGIIATLYFIKRDDFSDTLGAAGLLLKDREDLIHKAAGWMLREVGKRDKGSLEVFLNNYYRQMPRTMLRYAIERLPEEQRLSYLKGGKPNCGFPPVR